MKKYEPIQKCDYGELDPKVDLSPDFFTGFKPENRKEIVTEEAKFYRSITKPFSVDEKIEKEYVYFTTEDGYQVPVKVYRPKNTVSAEALPAFFFMHGGGFITCSAETHDFVPAYVAANANVIAFNIDYRLAPEYKFPIGLEDCYAVIKKIVSEASDYHIDPSKIIVGGDSSGGNFAAVITLMASGRKEFDIEKQVLIYPATEFTGTIPKLSAEVYTMVGSDEGAESSDAVSPLMRAYLNDAASEAGDPYVSPMLAEDLSGLPDALFIQAECDALLDDGLIYANLLKEAGVNVICEVYKGMPHAFILRTYEETFDALDKICAFVK